MASSLSGRTRTRTVEAPRTYPEVTVTVTAGPRSLNKELQAFFSGIGGGPNVAGLRAFVQRHELDLDHIHVLTLLHRCAKFGIHVPDVVSWDKVADMLERRAVVFDGQSIASSLYSLHPYSFSEQQVGSSFERYLGVLADKIDEAKARGELNLNGQAVGNALYGLQKCKGNTPASQRVINSLALAMDASLARRSPQWQPSQVALLSAQELGNSLWGLQSLSSDNPAALQLVSALANYCAYQPSDQRPAGKMSSQNVGMALYGLKGMSSEQEPVRRLLAAIVPRISHSLQAGSMALDPQAIGNALMGLGGMAGEVPEVQALLSLLAIGMDAAALGPDQSQERLRLSEQELACALAGLQNKRAADSAVLAVLESLGNKLRADGGRLRGQLTPRGSARVRGLLASLVQSLGGSIEDGVLRGGAGGEGGGDDCAMDRTVLEVQAVLTALSKRLREQTKLEIAGSKAFVLPIAPILLGFFLMSQQLSEFWAVADFV